MHDMQVILCQRAKGEKHDEDSSTSTHWASDQRVRLLGHTCPLETFGGRVYKSTNNNNSNIEQMPRGRYLIVFTL